MQRPTTLPPPLIDGIPISYSGLPSALQYGMRLYLERGILPGSFLVAVIRNDFMQATLRADATNQPLLRSIALWFSNHAPRESYGSPETAQAWLNPRRLLWLESKEGLD